LRSWTPRTPPRGKNRHDESSPAPTFGENTVRDAQRIAADHVFGALCLFPILRAQEQLQAAPVALLVAALDFGEVIARVGNGLEGIAQPGGQPLD